MITKDEISQFFKNSNSPNKYQGKSMRRVRRIHMLILVAQISAMVFHLSIKAVIYFVLCSFSFIGQLIN